ncbi:unnamed protein product [Clavelina lepadiformis]|uniref:G-protein coupled receptors family 1 profile domain-containing protein n=1 Tax=Clavelina lepadiformis TaxID=159417 RepID=A0ABP0GSQ6_CLALP
MSITSSTLDAVNTTSFPPTKSTDPWSDNNEARRVIELIFLAILTIVGTIGNLTVIFSIVLAKRVHSHGNVFVINLAVADLLVTGFVVPTVIANVAEGGNSLPCALCTAVGYTVTVTCTCSLCNLILIAVNRYWAVVRSQTYTSAFSKKRVYLMVVASWIWSNLLSLPTLVGWSRIAYDVKIMLCSWDDGFRYSFTIFITVLAIFIPLCIIFYCYWKLFMTVRTSGRWVRSLSSSSGMQQNSEQHRRSMRKERSLLKTLATTVAFFCICWLPYGFTIIIDVGGSIHPMPKKIFGWLGLSNSAVNFVIYGTMNRVFRRGYRNLFYLLFRCKTPSQMSSTAIHGSHSDSFYRSNRRKSNPNTGTPLSRNSTKTNPHVIHRGSNVNIQQIIFYRNQKIKVWTTSVQPWLYPGKSFTDSIFEAQKLPEKKTQTEIAEVAVKTSPPFTDKDQPKLAVANGLSVFKRPTSLLKKDRPCSAKKKLEEREARWKRNSRMLLQIEMGDDDVDDDMNSFDHRRTRSEIPNGVKKPGKKYSAPHIDTLSRSMTDRIDCRKTDKANDDQQKQDSNPSTPDHAGLHPDCSGSDDGQLAPNEPSDALERSAKLRNSMRQKEIIEGFVSHGAGSLRTVSPRNV